jgi:hypothetical protein
MALGLFAPGADRAGAQGTDDELSPGAALPVVRWGDLERDEPNQLTARMAYRRVDAVALYAGYRYHDATRRRPRLGVEAGYSFGREKGLWSVEVTQPLLDDDRLVIGAGGWHATRHFDYDEEIVGSVENTLAALFFEDDYRDWYDGQGARIFGAWRWSRHWKVDAGAVVQDERPLANETDWSVFGGDEDFRVNPEAARGTRHGASIAFTHDTRPHPVREGIPFIGEVDRSNHDVVRLSWHGAGGPLGGDFDFGLLRLDARGFLKLAPSQFLAARIVAATATGDSLPPQETLFSGGVGTLRAHPHKGDRGDRLLLANLEYSIDVWNAIQAMVFFDVGRAWFDDDHPNGPRFHTDGGLGLQTRDQHLRLQLARDLARDDGGLVFSVRTNATF